MSAADVAHFANVDLTTVISIQKTKTESDRFSRAQTSHGRFIRAHPNGGGDDEISDGLYRRRPDQPSTEFVYYTKVYFMHTKSGKYVSRKYRFYPHDVTSRRPTIVHVRLRM